MAALAEIKKKVLLEITPTKEEKEREGELLGNILVELKAVINKINPKVEPITVGSIAKGTDLRGDKDFDIFIQFPASTKRKELEEQGLDIGKRFFDLVKSPHEISYAEHPYTKGSYHGFSLEIVPCYKMGKEKKIKSAVDRSPLHTDFVVSKLKKKPVLRGEIRLLKRFMKANDLYGAHAAVEGFSGYMCELLVIKYGSFLDVLTASIDWKKHHSISMSKKSTKKFQNAPLVFMDPVDENRNVAAAVSVGKMAAFLCLAEAFIEEPREDFFHRSKKKPMAQKEFYKSLKDRATLLVSIGFRAPDLVEDTLVPQLTKSLNAIASECERAGFSLIKRDFWTDGRNVVFLLEFSVWELPRVMKKEGPFFDSKVCDLRGFFEANKSKAMSQPYLEGDKWTIDVERQYRHADDLIRDYLRDPKSFGKNLRGVKKFHLRINSDISKIKENDFWEFMSTFW
jgi:tRNA nucleotidyltransferase (CCA-adding enzyme)